MYNIKNICGSLYCNKETKMSKKVQDVVERGTAYYVEDGSGYTTIEKRDLDIDERGEVFGGEIVISYGVSEMPPHHHEVVEPDRVEEKMRSIEPDLRKWKEQA